jgi:hypothetical protein
MFSAAARLGARDQPVNDEEGSAFAIASAPARIEITIESRTSP